MMTLRTVRVAPRTVAVPPIAMALPRPGQAEPYEPAPEPGAATVAHRRHRFRGWLRSLRSRLVAWREEAVRDAWANGCRGGRLVERAEIAAHIRAELEAGHYDYRDGNGAVRLILAALAEDSTR